MGVHFFNCTNGIKSSNASHMVFDNFFILSSDNNQSKLTLMESRLINRNHPPTVGNFL